MAESTLTKLYSDLRAAIGFELGYGRTSGSWTSEQTANIAACLEDGQRRFYAAHEWSFLELVATIATSANVSAYNLPDDFASILGDITWPASGGGYCSIVVVGEGQIRAMNQGLNLGSGRPTHAATRVKSGYDGTSSTRWEVIFNRAFDAIYTITYRYRILPSKLTSDKYPLGGMQHADTLESACLAAAEQKLNGVRGVHWDEYQRLLAISIQRDNEQKPSRFGYNGDGDAILGDPRMEAEVLYNSQQST